MPWWWICAAGRDGGPKDHSAAVCRSLETVIKQHVRASRAAAWAGIGNIEDLLAFVLRGRPQ